MPALSREISVFTDRTSSASVGRTARQASLDIAEEKLILNSRALGLFLLFSIGSAVLIGAAIIRSAVTLDKILAKLDVLKNVKGTISSFQAVESMAELIYLESFARVKYFGSGLSAIYYAEMNQAVNSIDALVAQKSKDLHPVYFYAANYRIFNCSAYGIRSNLEERPEAIPLSHHRSLDERTIYPFDDADFYQCLLVQLTEILGQQVAKAPGFDFLWEDATAYFLSLRSTVNLEIALNYAFLTRDLVLSKGSVAFVRDSDRDNFDDALAMSQVLITRADQITPNTVGLSAKPASENLNSLVEQFTNIENATKAMLLVTKEKYEPTAFAKQTLGHLNAARAEFRVALVDSHAEQSGLAQLSIVSEAVKLAILVLILPLLVLRSFIHMKNESVRLQDRYDRSSLRYIESCKAIFRLLPEPVAKKLNVGQQVRPEYYHNVTVFYSDIVGFTSICSRLTAIEVLAMLNSIYTTFDNRTNAYKCYKIETIGDAYVVASGVPTRNSAHSAEIAALSLVLIEEVGSIKIPRSTQRIRIRVGINSGPVIAGIVGIKMFRYCLFGKTVIQANRMEQTSQPQKIHVSYSTYLELQKQGGFLLLERPKDEWPDECQTFWLAGRTTVTTGLSLFGSPDANMGNTEVLLAAR